MRTKIVFTRDCATPPKYAIFVSTYKWTEIFVRRLQKKLEKIPPTKKPALWYISDVIIITPCAHAQQGYSVWFVCQFVCLFVCLFVR